MKRDLYRGLLGGAEAALAWGSAERALRGARGRRVKRQLTQALERWEHEGGALVPATRSSAREA
jgi:hypothetical protein